MKVKCSKYPEEKCQYCEDRTWKECNGCKFNLYQNVGTWDKPQHDGFKKYNIDKEQEIMRDTIRIINTSKTYTLDVNKINTLEDVKKVLDGLCIKITLREGLTSDMYEKLKDYLK